jgi:NAD-specific glutamate dehydrogenase
MKRHRLRREIIATGEITRRALTEGKGAPASRLERWTKHRQDSAGRAQEMTAEIALAPHPDLAMLTVAARQLRSFAQS